MMINARIKRTFYMGLCVSVGHVILMLGVKKIA